MLDNKTFLQGINYLKANYLNWAFDLNNDLMLKVWYKKFSNLENATFIALVEKYTDNNKFAPNSPADLLELLKTEITKQELDEGEAWAYVRELIRKYGFYYSADKIYKELEDKPALYKTVQQFEGELRGLRVDDTNTPLRFKNAYKINLQRQVESKSNLLLSSGSLKLLQ